MREHPGTLDSVPEARVRHDDRSTVDIASLPVELIESEELVEEISIDGMCGVY